MINVDKIIKNHKIINNISLSIKSGEVVGLIGPNGAGKTTLMKMICGLSSISNGKILFNGERLNKYHNKDKFPVGALIENPAAYSNLSGIKNVEISARAKGIKKEELKDIFDSLIYESGLGSNIYKKVKTYSLGMKQRLGIAMSMIGNPQILLLDEPINGLDPDGIQYIRELIPRLSNDNITVIVSSHILSELNIVCSKFFFVKKGEIIGSMLKEELSQLNVDKVYKKMMSNEVENGKFV